MDAKKEQEGRKVKKACESTMTQYGIILHYKLCFSAFLQFLTSFLN